MKTLIRISFSILICCIVLATPLAVIAQTPTPPPANNYTGDQLVIANTFRLKTGETLAGNLAIVGGTASIESEAVMTGDVFLTGGTLALNGTINGDIIAIGGAVTFDDTAVLNGNLVLIGATMKRSPLAVINGEITEQSPQFLNFQNPGGVDLPFVKATDPLTKALTLTFQALALSALAVILGLLLPQQISRVAGTLTSEPLVTGGVGLLTIVVAPILLVILTITIILIPITVLAAMLLVLAFLFGWVAIGYEIGERFAKIFHTVWHPSISAGIGVLLLSLVTGFATMIPCIGWIIGSIVGILGLGAVVISRFGSSKFANKMINSVLPPKPPEPIEKTVE
jgi:hypothetical protein